MTIESEGSESSEGIIYNALLNKQYDKAAKNSCLMTIFAINISGNNTKS